MTRMFIKVAESVYKLWVTPDQWTSEALSEEGAKRGTRRATKCRIIPIAQGLVTSVQTGHEHDHVSVTWLSQYQVLQFYPKAAVCDYGAHPDILAFLTEMISCNFPRYLL